MAAKSADPMQVVAELEMEMMQDMYKRMTNACQQKCIASHYGDGELNKGESVCLDRCVAKYLDVHEKLGKVLTQMTTQDDKQLQQVAQAQQQK
ncbi:Zf-Tim10-DDP domain-containing protein [Aphelenchoides besseyi]|nr:Zf-Tim10-DDP domain-containing protein [Aphelenchoides besseyi]KAI6192695.1 Zf-Tim10-DDP domain-containing protein [Aphelenchoides besseyi]KAI6202950.1 Zf-Tim10-DDP domain-containing protein [Aphelenchoides besseyi]KAI6217300.1 Zf-Tim10-DDP domain-containing protein [Aphelenchoides besseyi]